MHPKASPVNNKPSIANLCVRLRTLSFLSWLDPSPILVNNIGVRNVRTKA